jgi:hypothetical protein
MANLVKIKEVHIYMGFTDKAYECYQAKELLESSGITASILAYFDNSQHSGVFDALGTWTWKDGQKTFSNFPIVTWKNCYDDFEVDIECAVGIDELRNSSLIANKHLV